MGDCSNCPADCPNKEKEPLLCSWCQGSGEGFYADSICQACKGLGEEPEIDDDD